MLAFIVLAMDEIFYFLRCTKRAGETNAESDDPAEFFLTRINTYGMTCRKVVRGNIFDDLQPDAPAQGEVIYECDEPGVTYKSVRRAYFSAPPPPDELGNLRQSLLAPGIPFHIAPRSVKTISQHEATESGKWREADGDPSGSSISLAAELPDEHLVRRLADIEQEAGSIRAYLSQRGGSSASLPISRRLWSNFSNGFPDGF